MALIKCPECGSEISDKAVRCPNCGIPAKVWNADTSYTSTQPAVKENIRKQETVVQEPAVGKKKGMISKIIVAILVIVCLLGIALKVIKDYTNNENTGTTEITNIDMGAIGNKITVDGTVAYVAGENKILVPYDFSGNFNECNSAAYSKSLAGCNNPRLPTDETDNLPEEVAREIISFYGEVGGFWTSVKADHATIEIVGQEPASVHYAGIMKNYLETDKDGVTWPKWGYCLSRIDDTARMGLLVLYDVIVDEFEFTDVEDTADPNYSTEYKTQMDQIMENANADKENTPFQQSIKYNQAIQFIEEGRYSEAYSAFYQLNGYKDSTEQLKKFLSVPTKIESASSVGYKDTVEYSYDENGNVIKRIATSSHGGGEQSTSEYTYDTNGRVIKVISGGDFTGGCTSDYSYNGNVVKEITKCEDGEYITEYTYDKNGYITTINDGERYYATYEYVYNNSGNVREVSVEAPHGGSFTSEYTYDENDNMIEIRSEYANGYLHRIKYIYDENGNIIEKKEKVTDPGDGSHHTDTTTYSDYQVFYRPGKNNKIIPGVKQIDFFDFPQY